MHDGDQIAYDRDSLVHRRFNFALVDEADSILIAEALIPLVISGAEDRKTWDTKRVASIVKALIPDWDFETDGEHRNVFLTDRGIERIESMLGCGSLYVAENQSLLEAVYCALHAQALLRRDVDYIVRGDRMEILDENQFGWGIEMVKAKNSGFVYMVYDAPHFTGPLFMLTLLLDRLCRRKQEL